MKGEDGKKLGKRVRESAAFPPCGWWTKKGVPARLERPRGASGNESGEVAGGKSDGTGTRVFCAFSCLCGEIRFGLPAETGKRAQRKQFFKSPLAAGREGGGRGKKIAQSSASFTSAAAILKLF